MLHSLVSWILVGAGAYLVSAQVAIDPQLVGTWSSKSNRTFTGPRFYDPIRDKMIEPEHTGISYSFTDNGHYESAFYRAVANPVNPACPKGVMQWQHGTYEKLVNGSLSLSPISVDGRQLTSDPCNYDRGIYLRYSQPEIFERYEVFVDPYHNIMRLNLFMFDGSPQQPLYLSFKPPQMLPTTTLNPTDTPTATSGGKAKRTVSPEDSELPLNYKAFRNRIKRYNADYWWYFGVGLTGVGGVLYFCF
ncbi:hypothetical protein M501DRAFT_999256 [Patellaria atrata CBS 101060]|uniref:Protein ROT1 n=1 Tax=Patellaria atrata CBS 101060 TaxID=1346257 RepID=A0A9P4VL69_9PEZI|nr:hypothetical protein M501DRAFT_999256 [Patellaria atrata CBS 101060]